MNTLKKTSKSRFSVYMQKLSKLLLNALLWSGICYALNVGLLYLAQLLLRFYLLTPMGPEFIAANQAFLDIVAKLSKAGFEEISIPLTLTALFTSLGTLSVLKLLFVARYIGPMGTIGRVIACVLPLSAVVAFFVPESVPVGGWEMAYGLSVFPTTLVFNASFEFVDELLPEADSLIELFRKKEPSGKKTHARR